MIRNAEFDIRKIVERGSAIARSPQQLNERINEYDYDRYLNKKLPSVEHILIAAIWDTSGYAYACRVGGAYDCRPLLRGIQTSEYKKFIIYALPKSEIENYRSEEWVRDFPIPEKPKKVKPGRLIKKPWNDHPPKHFRKSVPKSKGIEL